MEGDDDRILLLKYSLFSEAKCEIFFSSVYGHLNLFIYLYTSKTALEVALLAVVVVVVIICDNISIKIRKKIFFCQLLELLALKNKNRSVMTNDVKKEKKKE